MESHLIKYFSRIFIYRKISLFSYLCVSLLANLVIFPALGIGATSVFAENSLNSTEILKLTNDARKEAGGVPPLLLNQVLSKAAEQKAQNMFDENYWAHFGPNGESPWLFIKGAGYSYVYAGENLAKNFTDVKELHGAWMNSETHRKNILDPRFTEFGISIKEGILQGEDTILVVVMFGTPIESNQDTLRPPEILEPKDGSEFTDQNINLKAQVYDGDTIKIFRNNKFIGELPISERVFDSKIELEDGENILQVQSSNTLSNEISPQSLPVKVNYSNSDGKEEDDDGTIAGITDTRRPVDRFIAFFNFSIPNIFNLLILILILIGILLEMKHVRNHLRHSKRHYFDTHFALSLPLLIITIIYYIV